MKKSALAAWVIAGLLVQAGLGGRLAAAEQSDDLVQTIAGLVCDQDKDMRALGLEQVRQRARGPAATKRFAALLPKLEPAAQAGLLDALADRGDATARSAVLEMLASPDPQVHAAALRALGSFGAAADVPLLVRSLAKATGPEKSAAKASLTRLRGEAAGLAIAAELKPAQEQLCLELIGILAARRAKEAIPNILAAAVDANAQVRMAAMATLGKLAEPRHIADMLPGVLKAPSGPEREAAEKAVMSVCNGIQAADKRADPLLAALDKLGNDDRTSLLPLVGRVGGPAARKIVDAAMADRDPRRREAGFQALCNWPDASVADRLLSLVRSAGDRERQTAALRALIRVAALPDRRSDTERLDLLKKAMTLATRDQERKLVLARCPAIRTLESLRYVAPYLEQPALAQQACASVVALAHYRELRSRTRPSSTGPSTP